MKNEQAKVKEAKRHVMEVLTDQIIFYCSPTNLNSERERFFEYYDNNVAYNPQFKYTKILFDTVKVKNEISLLRKYSGDYKELINDYGKRAEAILKMIKARGTSKFSIYAKEVYGKITKENLTKAKEIVEKYSKSKKKVKHPEEIKKNKKLFTATDVKKKFDKLLEKYGWKTEIKSGLSSKMVCSSSERTLFIKKRQRFSEFDLLRLKHHEIRTHVKREFENRKIPALIRGSFDYIETEEGLAITMEERNDCLSKEQLRTYATRTLANHHGEKMGFFELFKKVKEYGHSDQAAFTITARAKRGLRDTSMPGSFQKDKVYFSGKRKVQKYLSEGGVLDDLFIGKVGIKDIKKVKKILKATQREEKSRA